MNPTLTAVLAIVVVIFVALVSGTLSFCLGEVMRLSSENISLKSRVGELERKQREALATTRQSRI